MARVQAEITCNIQRKLIALRFENELCTLNPPPLLNALQIYPPQRPRTAGGFRAGRLVTDV